MKRPLLTLLMASAFALPLTTAHAAGLSLGGSSGTSIGTSGSTSTGSSRTNSGVGLSLGAGAAAHTDLDQRIDIQRDTMSRQNGSLNDPDTISSDTTTSNDVDTNANANINATSNTSSTSPGITTNSGAGITTNARTNNDTGIGLGNGTIVGGALSNGTAAGTNVSNGIVSNTTTNANVKLDMARVRAVQSALKAKGYYTGTVDGRWGAATSRALQRFQIENRLAATGQADASTLNELDVTGHISGSGAAAMNPASN